MSKSLDDLKTDLMQLVKPYLQDLEELLKQKTTQASKIVEEHALALDTVDAKITVEEVQQFVRRLYDFQSVIMAVYSSTTTKKALPSLIDYIDHFNSIQVINFPTQDPHVRTLVSNLQNLSENDINEKWIDAFKREKIDILDNINQLLNYLTDYKITIIADTHGFVSNPELREYKSDQFHVIAKKDHTKVVLGEVRFRNTLTDVKSIVLRAIESFNSYSPSYEYASKYLIVFLYSQDQDHELNKAASQFKKHLVEIDKALIQNIFFIPIPLFKIEDLHQRIEQCLTTINGLEIKFDAFPNGWQVPDETSNLSSVFRLEQDKEHGRVLFMRLPGSRKYYIDYPISGSAQMAYHHVSFVIQQETFLNLFIEIAIKGSSKQFWFKIEAGEGEPKRKSNFEYIIYEKPFHFGNWFLIKVDVWKEFDRTFGTNDVSISRIEGIRLSGEMDIAKIYLE